MWCDGLILLIAIGPVVYGIVRCVKWWIEIQNEPKRKSDDDYPEPKNLGGWS